MSSPIDGNIQGMKLEVMNWRKTIYLNKGEVEAPDQWNGTWHLALELES